MTDPTPGPWIAGWGEGLTGRRAAALPYLDKTPVIYVPIRHENKLVCIVPVVTCSGENRDELMPDARLIAKARHLPELTEALRKAAHELNAIRARDGAPQHIDWYRGRPMQSNGVSPEYFNELVDECHAALALVQETDDD